MKDGYYWVKVYEFEHWEIAHIDEHAKVLISNYALGFHAKELYEIGDYIETPEKYKVK